jgi:hypothetical protein
VKTDAAPPMPSASDSVATSVKTGVRNNTRAP